jgi:uncharacterized protein (DUF934 family)
MKNLIRNDRVVTDDDWILIEADATQPLPAGKLLLPLTLWLEQREQLLATEGPLGVWLAGDDATESIAADLGRLALVAIRFPVFSDGRGYSSARILRERLGYRGELRAIGDVLRDQLFLMRRCGFDSFAVREDREAGIALAGLQDFHSNYQIATCDPGAALLSRGGNST